MFISPRCFFKNIFVFISSHVVFGKHNDFHAYYFSSSQRGVDPTSSSENDYSGTGSQIPSSNSVTKSVFHSTETDKEYTTTDSKEDLVCTVCDGACF
jgi:hypothetical protein